MSIPLRQIGATPKFRVETSRYTGVDDSVQKMRELAVNGQTHPDVRRWAQQVIRQVYPKDYLSEVAAIYYDTCRRIRYTRDPANAEMLHHPAVTLAQRAGDCDDQALLLRSGLGSALLAVGNNAEFVVVGFDRNAPDGARYTHVFLRVQDPKGRWIVLDPVAGPDTRTMIRKVQCFKRYET